MIKKIVQGLFNSLGYSLVKRPKSETVGYTTIKVGKFDIEINNSNGLRFDYAYCKQYGQQLMRLTALLYKRYPNLQAIDIGSNIGDSVALIKSGADVPVICIEGDKTLLHLFAKNTAQFTGITLIKTFLSDQVAEINCKYDKEGHNLTLKPSIDADGAVLTNFTTIDNLYQDSSLNNHCKLLKVDTEGFDLKILRGATAFINAVKPVILFEFNRENLANVETDAFSIFPALLKQGYNQILYYENDGTFMFSSVLTNQQFIKQMFQYIDGKIAKVPYVDLVVFHTDDDELATTFINGEEKNRL